MLDQLKYVSENREKKAFYASDVGKPMLDLYFAFRGVQPSNPPHWYDTLKWGAGKGVEEAILNIFKGSGIVDKEYDQKKDGRVEMQRNGVQINGYIDAIALDGTPIEVKSINNANRFDIQKYERGAPRESYVGQLSVYLDSLDLDRGALFVSSIDGLHRFWFDCNKIADKVFKCGETEVDLNKVYKKWEVLWNENVQNEVPPDIFEYMYKYPIDKVNWRVLSKSDITKARNNQKVIGDWEVQYSPWKNIIVDLQGETLGYTPKELEYIKEQTKGFTKW